MKGATGFHLLVGASLLAIGLSSSAGAEVQDVSAEAVAGDGDIVVTGTRLRSGLNAPTPVVVSSAQQLQSASPGLIAESLSQLPALRTSANNRTFLQSPIRDNGASFLNLRGIGKERTLVLLNGRRSVPSSTGGVPDVNLFPQDLVQRVETVTGGASAAYGSDAVAGVVNYILDTEYAGLRASGQAGISSRGDGASQQGALTAGAPFAGGQGHIVASFDYYNQKGIPAYNGRSRLESGYMLAPTGGTPSLVIAAPFNFVASRGGLIPSGPLANQMFLPNGELAPYNSGTFRIGPNQIGGDGEILLADLSSGIKRYAGFLRTQYELDDVTLYAEGSAAQVTSSYEASPAHFGIAPTAATIFDDNAFLTPATRASMAGAGIASFSLRRVSFDFPRMVVNGRSRTFRLVGGVDWNLGNDWELNAYYMHGENRYRTIIYNPVQRNLYAAIDAVVNPANGQIVCRSTLSGFDAGCVPVNVMGHGSASQAAIDYIYGNSVGTTTLKEDVASVALRGSPFALPAGPFNFAAGFEYRREAGASTVDAITGSPISGTGLRGMPVSLLNGLPGGFYFNNPQPLSGHYDIREGFVEVEAPLLRDSALAHSLSVNGALRYVDYSTVGGVTAWKIGANYEPFSDLRFRATRSRDIRAGNIQELFTREQTITTSVTRNGQTIIAFATRSGNPNVKPEKADTLTAGAVYRPSWLPGLGISIDYFNIEVGDAISQLTNQQTVTLCDQGDAVACSQLSTSNGTLFIRTPTLNLASIKTKGVDIEVNYSSQVGNGRLNARALASYVHELSTQVIGFAKIDRAGDVGYSNPNGYGHGTPHWSGTFSLSYDSGPWNLYVQERFVGPGKIDITLPPGALADNHVGAVFYTDVTVRHTFGPDRNLELFAMVNNLFDRDPPIVPNIGVGTGRPTNPALYDVIGRYMTFGAKVRF